MSVGDDPFEVMIDQRLEGRAAAVVPAHHAIISPDGCHELVAVDARARPRAGRDRLVEEAVGQRVVVGREAFAEIVGAHQMVAPLAVAHDLIGRGIPAGDRGEHLGHLGERQHARRRDGEDREVEDVGPRPQGVQRLEVPHLVDPDMVHRNPLDDAEGARAVECMRPADLQRRSPSHARRCRSAGRSARRRSRARDRSASAARRGPSRAL